MDFFTTVEKRRSVRKFTSDPVPDEVMRKAFEAAIIAPNSSNTQTWNFYWVRESAKKEELQKYCLNQSAARTAPTLVVVSADPRLWKRSQSGLVDYAKSVSAPNSVVMYFEKIVPFVYRWGFLNIFAPVKLAISFFTGLFRPMMRGPYTRSQIQVVAIKSAALAAENFVLALTAQGYASCMMEGFDEWRVKRMLGARCTERIVMVIAVGKEGERATWGPRYRMPLDQVLKIH